MYVIFLVIVLWIYECDIIQGLLNLYLLHFSFLEIFAEAFMKSTTKAQNNIEPLMQRQYTEKTKKKKKISYPASWVYFHVMQANFKRIGTCTGCFHLHMNWVRWQQVHLNLLKQSKHLPEAEPGPQFWSQRMCASAWALLQQWLKTKRPRPGTLLKLNSFDQNN